MNSRERFINTCLCKKTDRPPFIFEFGAWRETVEEWRKSVDYDQWVEEMNFDKNIYVIEAPAGYIPAFEYKVLEETNEYVISENSQGITLKTQKDGGSNMPQFLDYPVKKSADWERLKKERLDISKRDVSECVKMAKQKRKEGYVIQIGRYPYGVFGTSRDILGVENFLMDFYLEPEMVHNIMDYLTDFWISIYERISSEVRIDIFHIWEDMAGKHASLISPELFNKFMKPNYRKIKKFCDRYNIPIISVDTDGNCEELVPLFMDCGVNLIYPFEVAAGNDILAYRKKYSHLCIWGGFDKLVLAKDKESIDREIERIMPMFSKPGYIFSFDHMVQPGVPWKNFSYCIKRIKEIILGKIK